MKAAEAYLALLQMPLGSQRARLEPTLVMLRNELEEYAGGDDVQLAFELVVSLLTAPEPKA